MIFKGPAHIRKGGTRLAWWLALSWWTTLTTVVFSARLVFAAPMPPGSLPEVAEALRPGILAATGLAERITASEALAVFEARGSLYLRQPGTGRIFEMKGGRLNEAMDQLCDVDRINGLLTEKVPSRRARLFGNSGSNPFVREATFDENQKLFMVDPQGNDHLVSQFRTPSGAQENVLRLQSHPQVYLRVSQPDLLAVAPARLNARFAPNRLKFIIYLGDLAVEQELRQIPGAVVEVVPEQDPQRLLSLLAGAHEDEMVVVVSHNEKGFYRYPGAGAGGVSIADVDGAIGRGRGRVVIGSCEVSLQSETSGTIQVIHAREFAKSFRRATMNASTMGELFNELGYPVILDKSFLRPKPVSYAEKSAEFLYKPHPSFFLVPRTSTSAVGGSSPPPPPILPTEVVDGGVQENTAPSAAVPLPGLVLAPLVAPPVEPRTSSSRTRTIIAVSTIGAVLALLALAFRRPSRRH